MANDLVVVGSAPPARVDPLVLFAEFLRLDVANGDASRHTIRSYFGNVRQFSTWCAEQGLAPAAATEANLKDYRAHLVQTNARSTTATKLAAVRRFYVMAQARGLRPDNPAQGLKAPKDKTRLAEKRLSRCLTETELMALLSQCNTTTPANTRDRALLYLFFQCGPRVAELAGLDVADVDLEQGTMRVLGKGSKYRTLMPVGVALQALREWLTLRQSLATAGETAVFVQLPRKHEGRGCRMSAGAIRERVDHYLAAADLKRPGVSCHALRHTHATLYIEHGGSLLPLSYNLGHASTITTQIYIEMRDMKNNNPALVLDRVMAGLA